MHLSIIALLWTLGPANDAKPTSLPPPTAPSATAVASQSAKADATGASAADAQSGERTIRSLINAIRYKKDALALGKLATRPMSQLLMADAWKDLNSSQQDQFVHDLEGMLAATSFVKGREMFAYLDAIIFDAPKTSGDHLHIKSTVVVHRELKKVQLPIEWVLVRDQKNWRVLDIISMNESTADSIREEEVLPLLKNGGAPNVLKTLHERLEHVRRGTK